MMQNVNLNGVRQSDILESLKSFQAELTKKCKIIEALSERLRADFENDGIIKLGQEETNIIYDALKHKALELEHLGFPENTINRFVQTINDFLNAG